MGRLRESREADERIAPLLDEAAAAFEQGRPKDVLRIARRALEEAPRAAAALHYQAAAQLELGDVEAAWESYQQALAAAPDDPEILFGTAELLICHQGDDREQVEEGLRLCGRGLKIATRQVDEDLQYELLLLEGIAYNQLGECERALERLDEALELVPGEADALLERAIAQFELCRFAAAEKDLKRVLAQREDEPWAHHYLGLIAERRGDLREARRRLARAREISPTELPAPVTLEPGEFDAAVEDAVRKLPENVKRYLENTTIAIEDIPSDEDLTSSKPPLSPMILGVFRGTPVGERSVFNPYDHFPASIVLYQRNLERFAKTREELIEQIGITLMHEVGHLIGLDEEDLWERGLE
jgi:predicted Zn-dependent protease with MMP-like domain/Flp pilus assembly protein TadD